MDSRRGVHLDRLPFMASLPTTLSLEVEEGQSVNGQSDDSKERTDFGSNMSCWCYDLASGASRSKLL